MGRSKRVSRTRMECIELEKLFEDADSEMRELESDVIKGLQQLKLESVENYVVREVTRRVLQSNEFNPRLRDLKSLNSAALDSVTAIRCGVQTSKFANPPRLQTSSRKKIQPPINERFLMFKTVESRTQFFAEKTLESYNRDNPRAVLVLEEGGTSKMFMSGGSPYMHINCKVKDMDGNEQLLFAETTFNREPILLSHCILERGDTGDYSHHQIGCGNCGPNSRSLVYHPRGGFLHGGHPS